MGRYGWIVLFGLILTILGFCIFAAMFPSQVMMVLMIFWTFFTSIFSIFGILGAFILIVAETVFIIIFHEPIMKFFDWLWIDIQRYRELLGNGEKLEAVWHKPFRTYVLPKLIIWGVGLWPTSSTFVFVWSLISQLTGDLGGMYVFPSSDEFLYWLLLAEMLLGPVFLIAEWSRRRDFIVVTTLWMYDIVIYPFWLGMRKDDGVMYLLEDNHIQSMWFRSENILLKWLGGILLRVWNVGDAVLTTRVVGGVESLQGFRWIIGLQNILNMLGVQSRELLLHRQTLVRETLTTELRGVIADVENVTNKASAREPSSVSTSLRQATALRDYWRRTRPGSIINLVLAKDPGLHDLRTGGVPTDG